MKLNPEYKFFNEKYISDGIKDDYKKWKTSECQITSSNVFIESPTGTGKTYFIINKLFDYALRTNRSIIYVCNRDALKKQVEIALQQKMPNLLMIKENGICYFYSQYSTAVIIIANYQSIQKLPTPYPDNLFYVVFDEAHFFLEDSAFNVHTNDIYKYMLKNFQLQVHIFMSATITDFYELFCVSLELLLPEHQKQPESDAIRIIPVIYYHNSYSRPIYNIILYTDDSFVYDKIRNNDNDKWLYFVSSKNQGHTVQECIKYISKKRCSFLFSGNKQSKTWKTLIEHNRFDEDILITTSVIDNGVTIQDNAVKNIVLPFCYRTEFVQMLGRKRIDSDPAEKINVYVKIPSIQSINLKLRENSNKLSFWHKIKDHPSQEYKKKLVKYYWQSQKYNKLFGFKLVEDKIVVFANDLSLFKLYSKALFYWFLKLSCANTQAYIDCLYGWLGNNIKHIENEKICLDTNNLIDFLNMNVDRKIVDRDAFYESFLELYKIYCFNEYMKCNPVNAKMFIKALAIRKGNTQRKATINRSLNFLHLPFILKKENNYWILHKLPQ